MKTSQGIHCMARTAPELEPGRSLDDGAVRHNGVCTVSGGRRAWMQAAVAVPLAAGLPATSWSQAWPSKPVRLIVPFPAGGGTDAFARPLSKVLAATLGQSFVIDNRGGAGGTLGAEVAAKSPPDGYNWLVGAVHHTIAVSLYPKLGYELQKDLLPCTMLSSVPNVVVVNPQRLPQIKTFADFQRFVKSNPDKLNYGSGGLGSAGHLAGEMFKTRAGLLAVHIPYQGGAPAQIALLSGQVDFNFDNLATAAANIRSGKLLALAVTTPSRSPLLPEIPAVAEVLPGFAVDTWWGLVAPAGTPANLIQHLNQVFVQALGHEETQQRFAALMAEPSPGTPEAFGRFLEAELSKYEQVVKQSGASVD